jgi:tripartite ATP-independent transporter DctM subunit
MRAYNYSGRLATATLAAGGTLGILIPPSVVLVVYAILTEQNIAKLFAAAMIPGIIATIGYLISIGVVVRRHPEQGPALPRHSWSERLTTLRGVWPVAGDLLVVFGGIYGGVFTPTEGAAVGAVSTFVAGLATRELDLAGMKRAFLATAETSGMIFMIFVGADMLNSALALSQLPAGARRHRRAPRRAAADGRRRILVFYIALGCVMDELSMILLTIPVLFPSVMALDLFGLNPTEKAIWFGILVLMVVEIGLIAPPVGLNVYVVNGMARDVPMSETYKGVMPFLASDAVRVTLLVLFPAISLWLVRLMG